MPRSLYRRRETKPVPETVSFPITTPVYAPHGEYWPGDPKPVGHRSHITSREFAPYQPGELLLYEDGDRVMLGRVYAVLVYEMLTGYRIPKYRCQYVTKTGHWSANWRDVLPGAVTRAFWRNHEPIPRPETIGSLEQLMGFSP